MKTNKRKVDVSKRVKSSKKRKNSDSGNDDDSEDTKLTESDNEEAADSDDYEVDKLVEVRKKRDGTREFLVRWKKWSPKYDTWEPENNLSCPELIEEFMAENVAVSKKKTPTKATRSPATPKSKKSITFSTQNDNRRSSKRTTTKVTYGEDD